MDVTANLVTTSQLDAWMQSSVQRTLATVDEWCYAMSQILGTNGCPAIDPPGSGLQTGMDAVFQCGGLLGDGSNRSSLPQISSDKFLGCLRAAQVGASAPLPGGATTSKGPGSPPSVAPGGSAPAPSTVGQGVLGITNCSVCQQLASNPVLLLVIAVAAYYLFFEK